MQNIIRIFVTFGENGVGYFSAFQTTWFAIAEQNGTTPKDRAAKLLLSS